MNTAEKSFALLIDSDNVSAKYISHIINELTKYGNITYKRIYGDWTSSQTIKWKEKLLENSINPIQQFSNTVGKNATDSAMIIDAMDILYTKNVEGFCIVSSDSDFTKLASRLRESGMDVIGMGENKTPKAFKSACTIFTSLELLINQEEIDINEEINEDKSISIKNKDIINKADSTVKMIDKRIIEKFIIEIINENEGKIIGLGEIGSRLIKKYPDFDVRNYGYSLLSKFLEEMNKFNLKKTNNTITVTLKDNTIEIDEINKFIKQLVIKSKNNEIGLGQLSNNISLKYRNFNVKDYGYSTFSKFIQSIKEIEIKEDKSNIKKARYITKNKKVV